MNVNQKGVIGLIEVIRDLTRQGYECFTPIHDYSAVDLIVMDEKFNTFKIQVKYRETYRGIIDVPFKTMVNGKSKAIDLTAIDGWAVYCPEVDHVVYVGKHELDLTKNGFAFRLTEGKNSVNINKVKRKIYTEFGNVAEWPKAAPC